MDDAAFDRLIARARDRSLVPGIYNYCDRRCDRCRFTSRCLSYIDSQDHATETATAPSGSSPRGADTVTAVTASLQRALQMMRIIAEREGFDLEGSPEEQAEVQRDIEARQKRALAHPAVALGREYVMTSHPITRALWPVVMARGDAKLIDALETIDALCISVSSKTYRAVHGTLESDYDAHDLQSDENGSAKIARLLIAESRDAWSVLMEAGRATADGVPARLVAMLDRLDAAIADVFPRAMAFVRPGFDTEPLSREEEDRDPALAVLPQGHA